MNRCPPRNTPSGAMHSVSRSLQTAGNGPTGLDRLQELPSGAFAQVRQRGAHPTIPLRGLKVMLTMQDALLTLTRYWTGHGCMIVQPMNTKAGAGSIHASAAVRFVGPAPGPGRYP